MQTVKTNLWNLMQSLMHDYSIKFYRSVSQYIKQVVEFKMQYE